MRKLTKESEVLELLDAGRHHWGETHSRFAEADKYYERTFTIQKHVSVDAYKPPKAKNKVDILTDHICTIGRRVVVHPWRNTQQVDDMCGLVKRWGEAQLFQIENAKIDPIWSAIKHGAMYGKHVLKGPTLKSDAWQVRPPATAPKETLDAWERQRAEANPFGVRAVNPQNIIDDPWNDESGWVFETSTRRIGEVQARWPNFTAQKGSWTDWFRGNRDWQTVNCVEFWSKDQYCLLANGAFLTDGVEDNPYGFIPYHIGFGGLGYEAADGAPEKLAEGLIYPSIGSIKADARLKTAMVTYVLKAVAGERTIAMPQQQDFRPATVPWEYGVIPERYKYQVAYPPSLNPDLFRILPMVEQDIDEATYSPVLEGRQPLGAAPQSGYDRAQMSAHDRVRAQRLVKSIERSLGNILMYMGVLIKDVLKEPVTVWWTESGKDTRSETIKPVHFAESPVIEVRLDGRSPEERQRTLELLVTMWEKGVIPWEVAIKDGTEYDPTELRIQMYMEKILNTNPEIQAAVGQKMVELYGMGEIVKAVSDAVKMQRQKGTGGNGGMSGEFAREMTAEQQRLGPLGKPGTLGSPKERLIQGMPGMGTTVVQ